MTDQGINQHTDVKSPSNQYFVVDDSVRGLGRGSAGSTGGNEEQYYHSSPVLIHPEESRHDTRYAHVGHFQQQSRQTLSYAFA